jgi:TM2 domain-containing membrane protein YozV
LKKRIENISSLIESWCKKKIVFARPLLPFGTVREASAHCTHTEEKSARVQFLPSHYALLKVVAILILMFTSLSNYAQDSYITTVDLNLRSGAGKNYKSITVLAKGDTVKLLDNSGDYWAKIQYQDKIGYSAKQYIRKIQIAEKKAEAKTETATEGGNGFITFLIFLLIIIVTAIILKKTGEKYRDKLTAIILSLFFGAFGFQKFYLGEINKGTYSVLFSWTFIPMLIGLIDFIKLAVMNEMKFNNLYNWGKSQKTKPSKQTINSKPERESKPKVSFQQTTYSSQSKQNYVENSIIDINSEKLDLTVEKNIESTKSNIEVPYWSRSYVYSYDELNYASKAQRKFYFYFRNKVLNHEFVDIQGNTNYGFILYFDLLNEYENHRDIKLLEEQFKFLGQICPKTKSYSLMSLQDLLRKRTDSYSVDKLTNLQEPNYQFEHGYSDYDPDAYKLGKQYKDKLELNKQEVAWLNKFWNPSNVFISIEGCCIATIKQYLLIIKSLNKKLKTQNTSIAKEVIFFKEKIFEVKDIADSYSYAYDNSYLKQRVESEIYLTIFKRVENSVRESFGHKRKVGSTLYYDFKGEFETRIGNYVDELVLKYQNNIEHPDLETQIEINAHNVNRWKIEFNNIRNSFQKENKINFIDGIINLEETNQKNPNIESIFFEASKFISKFDKVQSLKYYAKYIYYDLKSKKFDNKELTKTIQKTLFKTDEQINNFKKIIAELIETTDIHKALNEVEQIYIPKRKKIKLDKSVINEVEKKYDGTVELLNGYLETENEEANQTDFEKGKVEILVVPTNTNNSIFISGISIGKIQEELIAKIVSNSFKIHQNKVDKFATENGLFKNQLIDSINVAFEEYLEGEALIEEDEENYVIEESYYKELVV